MRENPTTTNKEAAEEAEEETNMSDEDLSALLVDAERHRISDLCAELRTDLRWLLTVLDPKRQTQRYNHVKLRFGFSPCYRYIYLWSERR